MFVGVQDATGPLGAVAALDGHGSHGVEGGVDEPPVRVVGDVGGGEVCVEAGDGDGKGDGGVDGHGSGDDQTGGLVVELGEAIAVFAALLGAEGGCETFACGDADDQAAVEAVGPRAKDLGGAESGAETRIVVADDAEVGVGLVPVPQGAGPVAGEGGVD